jgi:hypothetical protein
MANPKTDVSTFNRLGLTATLSEWNFFPEVRSYFFTGLD